jgi:hypothetical protein
MCAECSLRNLVRLHPPRWSSLSFGTLDASIAPFCL